MAKLHGLKSRTSTARVIGPPPRGTIGMLLKSPPGIGVVGLGHRRTNLTRTRTLALTHYPSSGHIAHCHCYHSGRRFSEPCLSHSGLFSSSSLDSDPVPNGKPSAPSVVFPTLTPFPPRTSTPLPAATGNNSTSGTSPRQTDCILLRHAPRRPMAYNTYSTASSDISTPRSASPSSVFSGRSSHTSLASKRLSLSLQRRQSAFNPMSTVDIASIEQRMKMASLDGLRGYAQDHYGEVKQYRTTDYVPKSAAAGYQVLREPLWNKGVLPSESFPRHLPMLQLWRARCPT
jgi:hypothetical protein